MKKIVIIGLVLLSGGLSVGLYLYNKPKTDLSRVKAEIVVRASDLVAEYEVDENASNAKYLGKVIEVTGTLQQIEEGENIVLVLTAGDMSTVRADLVDNAELEELQVGVEVRVRGLCSGYLLDVILNDCVIVQP